MADPIIYSDLDFKMRKLSTGDVNAVVNEYSINQSLMSLFNTRKGERIFNPEYGSDLSMLLFEPFNEITGDSIVEEIQQAIRAWENSRINLTKVSVVLDYDHSVYIINIQYSIISTVNTGNLNFNLQA